MTISLIVAMDEGSLIGRQNQLPWRLPDDLKHFRRLTLGKTVLMGRKTFQSMGKALDGRTNWVVTRDPAFSAEGCRVFSDLESAVAAHREGELMVIGGAEIFRETLPLAHRIYLTRVHARLEGDVRFPELALKNWRVTERAEHAADARHAHAFTFETLERAG